MGLVGNATSVSKESFSNFFQPILKLAHQFNLLKREYPWSRERSHHKAGISPLGQMLGFDHHAVGSTLDFQRLIFKLVKDTSRDLRSYIRLLDLLQWLFDLPNQSGVLGQSQYIFYPMCLTPNHGLVSGEARISPNRDLYLGHCSRICPTIRSVTSSRSLTYCTSTSAGASSRALSALRLWHFATKTSA